MSKEWYLIHLPTYLSGFEDSDFKFYSQAGFEEMLSSFMGSDVVMYKDRIDKGVLGRAIFQNVTSDSITNSSMRRILLKIDDARQFQYVKDLLHNEIWIVNSLPSDNGFYGKVLAWYCNYNLHFISKISGDVCEYPVYASNVSQANSGEMEKSQITLGDSKYLIYLPYNEETIKIDRGQRILLSRNQENPMAYEVTQVDNITYKFGERGLILLFLKETQFSKDRDNKEIMVADYYEDLNNSDKQGWW